MPSTSLLEALYCATSFENVFTGWPGVALLAMVASVLLLTIIYMIVIFFDFKNLIPWIKMEYYEIGVTAMLTIIIISFIGVMCTLDVRGISPQITASLESAERLGVATYGDTIYSLPLLYLEDQVEWIEGAMDSVYYVYAAVDFVGSISYRSIALSFTPLGGFAAAVKTFMKVQFVTFVTSLAATYGQLLVFGLSPYTFLKYYLPIGLFARSFTPTRRIGGTLLGIAVGFLFIPPLLLTFDYAVFVEVKESSLFDMEEQAAEEVENYLRVNTPENISGYGSESEVEFREFLEGEPMSEIEENKAEDLLAKSLGAIGLFKGGAITFFGLFLPAFNTLLLITAVRHLSAVLGEEIDISNLTRMI